MFNSLIKLVCATIGVFILLPVIPCQAEFISIDILSGPQAVNSVQIEPGQSLDIFTEVNTDLVIAGMSFDVVFPESGWQLESRNYDQYGWIAGDQLFDNSVPALVNLQGSLQINPSPLALPQSTVQFASAFPGTTTNTSTFRVEDLQVIIPENITAGMHTILVRNIQAFDSLGAPLHLLPTTIVSSNPFSIDTSAVIPEPGTNVLFAILVLSLLIFAKFRTAKA